MTAAMCRNGHPMFEGAAFCRTCGTSHQQMSVTSPDGRPGGKVIEVDTPAPASPPPGSAASGRHRRSTGPIVVSVAMVAGAAIVAAGLVISHRGGAPQTHTAPASSAHATTTTASTPTPFAPPVTTSPASTATTTTPPPTPPTTSAPPSTAGFPILASTQVGPGPTFDTRPFGPGPGTILATGAEVHLLCSAYGDTKSAAGVTSKLWDFTDRGWVPDVFVYTGTSSPVTPACQGTVAQASAGSDRPSTTLGPYPLVPGRLGDVFEDHSLSAPLTASLPLGTFVHLHCYVRTGITVPAAASIAFEGGNDEWDEIDAPVVGWVPDSWVASSSNGSVAPPC